MDTNVLDRQAENLEMAAKGVRKSKEIEMFFKTLKYATDIMRKFDPEDLNELRHISEIYPEIGRLLKEFVFENVKEDITVYNISTAHRDKVIFPQVKAKIAEDFIHIIQDPNQVNIKDHTTTNLKDNKKDNKLNHPDYLTTQDVANILGVSTQMVRRYCNEGQFDAWRTQGNKGEWRINVEQFKTHTNYIKMVNRRTKNLLMADLIEDLSNNTEYQSAIDRIEEERKN
ncbi:helix-turn-helix domain-containing protein [Priestia megaterium]|uniref:helix-turn-helix domain-containing protein n=1 Tax=Priestia megaterium TaxID=1404 RepID=UPI0038796DCC